jgi:TusA-related sulfurtransferase
MTEKEIDMCGMFCPEPVFRTKIAMEQMQTGDILTVTADDPEAESDINTWIKRSGNKLIKMSKNENKVTFKIEKTK